MTDMESIEFSIGPENARKLQNDLGGTSVYIPKRNRKQIADIVRKSYNGKNASQIARKLGISRSTVYNYLNM